MSFITRILGVFKILFTCILIVIAFPFFILFWILSKIFNGIDWFLKKLYGSAAVIGLIIGFYVNMLIITGFRNYRFIVSEIALIKSGELHFWEILIMFLVGLAFFALCYFFRMVSDDVSGFIDGIYYFFDKCFRGSIKKLPDIALMITDGINTRNLSGQMKKFRMNDNFSKK